MSNNNKKELNEKEELNEEIKEKKTQKKRNIIISLVVLLVLFLAGGGYYLSGEVRETVADEEKEEEPPLVEAEPIHRDNLQKTASLTGNVEPDDTVMVIPQLSGEIESIHVEEGDRVEEGELLMTIDDHDYRLQLEEAQSARDAAQAQLDEAEAGPRDAEVTEMETTLNMAKDQEEQMEKEFERIESLHEEGFVSDQELEQAEMQYKNAKEQAKAAEAAMDAVEEGAREEQLRALRSQVNQADVGVRLAQQTLDRAQVEAPGSGTIASLDVSEGDMADTASPSMILIDTDVVIVNAVVPETYINNVNAGQDVLVNVPSAREEPYENTIQRIGDMPPEDGRGYPIEVVIPNEEGLLRAGMFSRLEVVVDSSEDVIVVPRNAILEEDGESGVYVVEDEGGQYVVDFRIIETGIAEDGMIEVVDGLDEGERVITAGLSDVGPGDEVRLNNS
ncbi:efflux RND transporter periplasmic adaptor subunit [Natranaerofaba carboxydovora]|uniref:efflux RND transporter periplasmic adaptor subunit n=1 Tax=Natranaerofaba carboxydovora TaxID=2742683 RepID=UPI001F145315|nr:efflux RND transporter periplasmic adaptor subunit [Natranaerofaba carboxydovora]